MTMTKEQIELWYKELSDLIRKHNIGMVSGIWFSAGDSGEYGFIQARDLGDPGMCMLCKVFSEKIYKFSESINAGTALGTVKFISIDPKDKN